MPAVGGWEGDHSLPEVPENQTVSHGARQGGRKGGREGGRKGQKEIRSDESVRLITFFHPFLPPSLPPSSPPSLPPSHVPDELVQVQDPRPGFPQPSRDWVRRTREGGREGGREVGEEGGPVGVRYAERRKKGGRERGYCGYVSEGKESKQATAMDELNQAFRAEHARPLYLFKLISPSLPPSSPFPLSFSSHSSVFSPSPLSPPASVSSYRPWGHRRPPHRLLPPPPHALAPPPSTHSMPVTCKGIKGGETSGKEVTQTRRCILKVP